MSSEWPSIFFVSLPKSGTVFTWHSLEGATGLKIPAFHELEGWHDYTAGRDFSCPTLYACGDYNTQLLRPENMQHFKSGYVFGAHMQASYHNIRVLKESGIERITVLLRDPRDALVSWVHHLRSLGLAARDYHSKIYHIPRDYYGWRPERQLAFQIRSFLPVTVNWVEGWLDYFSSDGREIEIQFVYYDELKRRPELYIRRIADFHRVFNADLSKIATPEPGRLHFRRGEHEQWREEFSESDVRLVEDMMENRIPAAFDLAAASLLGGAPDDLDASVADSLAAANNALKTIVSFPNYRPAYAVFTRALAKCGMCVNDIERRVDLDLQCRSIAGQFVYRYELVDKCIELFEAAKRSAGINLVQHS